MSDPGNLNPNTKPNTTPSTSSMTFGQKARIVTLAMLAILLTIFVIQNANRVKVEFLNMDFMVSIIMIILVSALIGGLITFLLMKHRAAKRSRK